MSPTSIADSATLVTGVTTSGAEARVQGGETDLPKIPLTGGRRRRRRSRKSQSKKRKTRGVRRHRRRTAKK
jgi:hypothetical protein